MLRIAEMPRIKIPQTAWTKCVGEWPMIFSFIRTGAPRVVRQVLKGAY